MDIHSVYQRYIYIVWGQYHIVPAKLWDVPTMRVSKGEHPRINAFSKCIYIHIYIYIYIYIYPAIYIYMDDDECAPILDGVRYA